MTTNDLSRLAYLAGIFDGEGSVPKIGQRQITVVANTEEDILQTVQDELTELGIPWKRYTSGIPKFNNAQGFTVKLTTKKAISSFYELVPFRNVRKRERMKELLESYIRDKP